jgi:hypothetical protein
METVSSLRKEAREYLRLAEFATTHEERMRLENLSIDALDRAEALDRWSGDGAAPMGDPSDDIRSRMMCDREHEGAGHA